jgi:hypothetical protein
LSKYVPWKDYRWVYLLLIVIVSWPLLSPIGLPVPVTKVTQMAFDTVEKLPQGSLVAMSSILVGGNWPDLGPPEVAFVQHLFKKKMKIVFIGEVDETPTITETTLLPKINTYGAQYGVDYVNLGYIAGVPDVAEAAFATSLRKVISVDFVEHKPLDELPIMKGVNTLADFKLAIHIGMAEDPVRQYYTPFKIPLLVGVYGMMGPHYIPYIDTGQLSGMIVGLRGAAEYEHLVGFIGEGLQGADALSMTHLLVAIFVVLGNVYYLYQTRGRTKKEK